MKIIFAFFYLFPLLGFCQGNEIGNTGKLSIGLSFSPNYSFRQLKYSEENKWIMDMRNDEEIPKYGFATGVNLHFQISRRIALETGIIYSDQGESTRDKNLTWATPNPAYPVKGNVVYHYQYIDFPLSIEYSTLAKRINYSFSSGIIMNVFIAKRSTVKLGYADGHKNRNTSSIDFGYNKINLSAILGFGLNYKISNRLVLQIKPVFQRSITSIVSDRGSKEYLYNFALCSGVYYKLSK